ncbi:MAG: hypothetical protein Q4C77_10825 [Eubacteriales bacterium]|nr:hypothetical protein [Eubacteriales bacterium]
MNSAAIGLKDDATGTIAVPENATESKDIYTGYTNTRSGVIPTGIGMSVLPALFIGLIAICGIIVLVIRGRRRES